ncbi:MAG: restriction endonuclease [Symbiobacteriaceae bacterium]|jgi:hypothetical protein|nr:restriction endonuclease [Symbiobacteriaceae bacterium]
MLKAIPWPIYILVAGAIGLPVIYLWVQATREDRLLRRAGLGNGRQTPLPEFIRYLEALFTGLGYHVKRPAQRDDYGADLLLKDGTGRQTAVSARHFKERIGPEVLSEIAEGADHHDCEETLIVSLVGFTNTTLDRAEETGTILWDASDLAEAMGKVRSRPPVQRGAAWEADQPQGEPGRGIPEARHSLAALAATRQPMPVAQPIPSAPPEPEPPSGPPCPVCSRPMEPKIAAGREIWLCSRFPRCNGAQLRETPQ